MAFNSDKEYEPTELEKDELSERKAHEEEMKRAEERLERAAKRKKTSFICATGGVIIGVLYILWITFGPEIMLPSGVSLYEAYISIAKGSGVLYALLDFAPPVILASAFALTCARGEKGKIYFVTSAILTLAIVVAVFMLYMSLMAG